MLRADDATSDLGMLRIMIIRTHLHGEKSHSYEVTVKQLGVLQQPEGTLYFLRLWSCY